MISLIGNCSIFFSMLFFSLVLVVKSKYHELKRIFFVLGCGFSFLSFLILVSAFVLGEFSIRNVFFNSSHNKELYYKISASWSSNEGSILLWNSFLSFVCVISLFLIGKFSKYQEVIFMNVASAIVLLYSIFTLFFANPFEQFKLIPKDGMGLNPILQDQALMIHPPILYLGYIFSFMPFIISVMMILDPPNVKKLMFIKKRFTAVAISFLSLGIGLGSWWAYRELGWGDFWFFDPVENLSLIPLIILIASYHFIISSKSYTKHYIYSIFLSFIVFIVILYSISLVRSGLISSVHSFAFSRRSLFLFVIALFLHVIAFFFLYVKRANLRVIAGNTIEHNLFFQQIALPKRNKLRYLTWGNILLVLSAFVIIFTILTQLFFLIFLRHKVSIESEFFIKSFIPIFAFISFFMSCLHLTKYQNYRNLIKSLILISTICIVSFLLYKKNNRHLVMNLNLLASIALMFSVILDLLIHKDFSFIILKRKKFSMHIGHLGFGILVLSIALNHMFSEELLFEGKIGDVRKINKIEAKFLNIKIKEEKSYFKKVVEFFITTDNFLHKKSLLLKPEQRFYKIEKQISSEVDIYSYLLEDIYCVIIYSIEDYIKAKIFYRPFMSFIWLSYFLISWSFILNVTRRKN